MSNKSSIFAIGHSTRSIEGFIALLTAHRIEIVIDVRTIPRSRHCPQFNKDALQKSLRMAKIAYQHFTDLGGLRHAKKDSVNTGWKNLSFRGFADYMQTTNFQKALKRLETLATRQRCALMCAEGVPWRCHRSLILDALSVRGWQGFHIQSRKSLKQHKCTPFLRVRGHVLIYA